MLLPQLLGQASGGNTNIRFGFQTSQLPSSSSQQQQQQQPHRHPFGLQSPFFNASTAQPAASSNETNAQQGPQRQTTRLQFIVPGEPGGQFDLYGLFDLKINCVYFISLISYLNIE